MCCKRGSASLPVPNLVLDGSGRAHGQGSQDPVSNDRGRGRSKASGRGQDRAGLHADRGAERVHKRIPVTPEMIEVGAALMLDLYGVVDVAYLAERVYTAMAQKS